MVLTRPIIECVVVAQSQGIKYALDRHELYLAQRRIAFLICLRHWWSSILPVHVSCPVSIDATTPIFRPEVVPTGISRRAAPVSEGFVPGQIWSLPCPLRRVHFSRLRGKTICKQARCQKPSCQLNQPLTLNRPCENHRVQKSYSELTATKQTDP